MILSFDTTAIIVLISWLAGLIHFYFPGLSSIYRKIGIGLMLTGILFFALYIAQLWAIGGRAPLRTLGETRLWYTLFISSVGIVIYKRWNLKWMPLYSIFLASVFLIINFVRPENFDKHLMPALQSYWFVPHVIVYMFAYAVLGVSMLIGLKGLAITYLGKQDNELIKVADNLVYVGFAFLTFGLLFGALWAKEAWGHYWTWDPKETWAFLTWLLYLIYIHWRTHQKHMLKQQYALLAGAFFILLISWFGVNYLPVANESVHTYFRN